MQSTSSEGTCVSRCTPGVGAADCNTVNFMLGSRCELLRCDRCLPDDCVLTSTSFLGSTTKVLTALPQSGGELPPTQAVLHLDASKATGCAAVDSASGLRFSAWAADSTGGTMGGEVQRGRFYGTSALDLESSRLASSALLQLGDAFTLAFWVAFAPDAGDVDADAGAARVYALAGAAGAYHIAVDEGYGGALRLGVLKKGGTFDTSEVSVPSRQWVLVVAVGTCEGTTNDPKGVLRFSVGENEAGLSGMSEPVEVGKPCGLAVDGIGSAAHAPRVGRLAEAYAWDRALTSTERLQLWRATSTRFALGPVPPPAAPPPPPPPPSSPPPPKSPYDDLEFDLSGPGLRPEFIGLISGLSGLFVLVCLCCFVCKRRRKILDALAARQLRKSESREQLESPPEVEGEPTVDWEKAAAAAAAAGWPADGSEVQMQQLGDGWAGQYPPQYAGYASPEHAQAAAMAAAGQPQPYPADLAAAAAAMGIVGSPRQYVQGSPGVYASDVQGAYPAGASSSGLYPPPFSASALYGSPQAGTAAACYGSPQAGMAVDLSQVDPYAMIEANRKMKEENRKMKAAFCGGAAASKSGVDLLEASKSTDPYAVWRAEYAAEKATEWPMSPAPPASYGGPGWQSERLPRSGGGGVSSATKGSGASTSRSPRGLRTAGLAVAAATGLRAAGARSPRAAYNRRGPRPGPSAAPVPLAAVSSCEELAAEAAPPWTPATSVETVAPRPPSAGVDSTGGSDEGGAEAWPDVPDGVAGADAGSAEPAAKIPTPRVNRTSAADLLGEAGVTGRGPADFTPADFSNPASVAATSAENPKSPDEVVMRV